MAKVRMEAVRLVKYRHWSTRKVARYTGFNQSTIARWCEKDPTGGWRYIATESSRPHSHPKALPSDVVRAILEKRRKRNRCAEIVHQELLRDEVSVSLSSVKRTLKRHGLIRPRSPWKSWHFSEARPLALNPGDLVQVDTIHIVPKRYQTYTRFYVYTLLDVFTRWAWARVYAKPNTHNSLYFVKEAQKKAPFLFSHLQSDHGSEFSMWFTENVKIAHRHSRVRKPNDNGHLERFNRTIQEECLNGLRPHPEVYQRAIAKYLPYYNEERLHLGLECKTPLEVMRSY